MASGEEIKFPDVEVQLTGEDGNAMSIIARVSRALLRAGVDVGEVDQFRAEATRGDYNHVLAVVQRWVTVA